MCKVETACFLWCNIITCTVEQIWLLHCHSPFCLFFLRLRNWGFWFGWRCISEPYTWLIDIWCLTKKKKKKSLFWLGLLGDTWQKKITLCASHEESAGSCWIQWPDNSKAAATLCPRAPAGGEAERVFPVGAHRHSTGTRGQPHSSKKADRNTQVLSRAWAVFLKSLFNVSVQHLFCIVVLDLEQTFPNYVLSQAE